MRRAFVAYALLALSLTACEKDIPQSQMPHFATFCVPRTEWNYLLADMKLFGKRNGLELHGGIEGFPGKKPIFNAYLAKGYSYYFGDDLDLWIVSNPYVEGEMSYGGINKEPWSEKDLKLARSLTTAVAHLRCQTSGS